MVDKEDINNIITNILNQQGFLVKCKAPINEIAYNNLQSNEDVADFFGLTYLSDGRPGVDNAGATKNICFIDKRNNVTLTFYTDEGRRMTGVDFNNNYDGESDSEYICNLKDLLRAYYEAPYSLKKATMFINFEHGTDIGIAGDCYLFGVNIYNSSLYGDGVKETLYHEMSHAFSFQYLDWKNGEEISDEHNLPSGLKERWDKATQQDYKYQEEHNYTKQDTTKYGETNQLEDFAEMGGVVSKGLTNSDYKISNAYSYRVVDETRPSGYRRVRQTTDDIISANPNRVKLMKELIGTGKNVDIGNKQDFIDEVLSRLET